MKLGVHIGYWGLGLTSEDQLAIVQEAERLGLRLASGPPRPTAPTRRPILAWLAGADLAIKLGSAIFQIPGRSPAMTAMTAATIDQLSDGRMLLGIGSSRPAGQRGLARRALRQSARSARASTSRSCARRWRASGWSTHGEHFTLPLPDGPGKALKLTIAPVQERDADLPGGDRPEEHRAGRRDRRWLDADAGVARAPADLRAWLDEGAARAGRTLDDGFDIAPTVNVFISEDVEGAATSCARSSRCTSAAWARATRTSTTSSSSGTASRTRRRRSRTCISKAAATRRWPRCRTS